MVIDIIKRIYYSSNNNNNCSSYNNNNWYANYNYSLIIKLIRKQIRVNISFYEGHFFFQHFTS